MNKQPMTLTRTDPWDVRANEGFLFMDYEGLVMPTGIRAINLKEMLDVLRHVPLDVIHHHLHRTPLHHRFGVWDYPNDFAHWVAHSLEDRALAEKLAALDPYSHEDLEDARAAIVELVEDHLDELPTVPWARPGFDFHFASGHFVELPSERLVFTLGEMREALTQVPLSSIFAHFHEARRREPGRELDDFSRWIERQFGSIPLVQSLRGIDFYFYSLEELRRRIVAVFDEQRAGGEPMTAPRLDDYAPIVGAERIAVLRRLAGRLEGLRVVVVNSTRVGGGVAELLTRHVPLFHEMGIDMRWEVIEGTSGFFEATKTMHNALQGSPRDLSPALRDAYIDANRTNAERINLDADVVVIHDPQPAPLIDFVPKKVPWIWRCHIDASRPNRSVWKFLRKFVAKYDASVFSMPAFSQNLSHPQYLIAPSIDPLAPKNADMDQAEVDRILARFGLDRSRPLVVQVSRFDRFKDPVGVVRAFRMVRRRDDCRLVLVGGSADDDPEGSEVLAEVREEAGDDPDITILSIPPDSDREINALQRAATVIVQKSTKEGFGLTVTEGLWKARPVVGGAVGGIQIQVYDHSTGFLVSSVEGCAFRLRYLLNRPRLAEEMGERGRELVRHHYLLTRDLRDWLTLFLQTTGRAAV